MYTKYDTIDNCCKYHIETEFNYTIYLMQDS